MRPVFHQFSGFDVHAQKFTGVYGLLDYSDISSTINGYDFLTNSEEDTATLGHIGQYMQTTNAGVQLQGLTINSTPSQMSVLRQKLYARFRITSIANNQDWSTRNFASCQCLIGSDHFYGPSIFGSTNIGGNPYPRLLRSNFEGSNSTVLADGPNYPAVAVNPLILGEWYDLQIYQDSTIGYMRCVFTPLGELGEPIILEAVTPVDTVQWGWAVGRAVYASTSGIGGTGPGGGALEIDWDDVFVTTGAEGPGDNEDTGLDHNAFLRAVVYASGSHAYYASDYSNFNLWGHLMLVDNDGVTKAFQHPDSNDPKMYSGNSGPNYCNVVKWVWETHPRTGAILTEADIKGWGLCGQVISYHDAGDPPEYEWDISREGLKLTAASLAFVKTTARGQPYVQPIYASPARFMKGTWQPQYAVDENDEPIVVPVKSLLSQFPRRTSERTDMGYPGMILRAVGSPSCISFPFGTNRPLTLGFGLTFSEEYRVDYRDWGSNFKSYFITGYNLAAGASRKFESNYTTVSWENVPNGGAYFQHIWDYSTSPYTGQWQPKQQVYKTKVSYAHGLSKLKARGSGKSLQMRIESEDQKNFAINGWIMDISGDAK